jgi:hypothetical protein
MNITYNVEFFPDGIARRIDGCLHSLPIIGSDKISHVSVQSMTGIVISHTNLELQNLTVEADDLALESVIKSLSAGLPCA